MKVNKYDYKTKKYIPTEVPDDWNIKTYSDDMEEIINCINCGAELPYGLGYTSRRWHTKMGFGYCECEDCDFSYSEVE